MGSAVQTSARPETKPSSFLAEIRPRQIVVRGARVHNLRDVDVDVPLGQLVAVTGVSGSGKTSLVFDTIAAEGQRQYLETCSARWRRRLRIRERPDVDQVRGVPPVVAIRADQAVSSTQGRVPFAAAVGLLPSLAKTWAAAGIVWCPRCDREVRAATVSAIAESLLQATPEQRLMVAFPVEAPTKSGLAELLRQGFTRAILDHAVVEVATLAKVSRKQQLWVVVDRLITGRVASDRLHESLELAAGEGAGRLALFSRESLRSNDGSQLIAKEREHRVGDDSWQLCELTTRWECTGCGTDFVAPVAGLFDPSRPESTCGTCQPHKQGRIRPDCAECQGTGWHRTVLAVRWRGDSVGDWWQRSAADLSLALASSADAVVESTLSEIHRRIETLTRLRLAHHPLGREYRTFATGDRVRMALAAIVGLQPTGTLVCVDEPTAGLARDEYTGVIDTLRDLQRKGNSVIAVEHALDVLRAADYFIELGPGPGPQGGTVVFTGLPNELETLETSTGRAWQARLAGGQQPVSDSHRPQSPQTGTVTIRGDLPRGLGPFTAEIPLGQVCVVRGATGIGLTTLVMETLVPSLAAHCRAAVSGTPPPRELPPRANEIRGAEKLVEVLAVDATPLSRSPRSVLVSWLGVFDEIRDVFANTAEAKLRGFTATTFSYHAPRGGRCEKCHGTGVLRLALDVLPDWQVPCSVCEGTRYRRETLAVRYRGYSISDVLQLAVSDAATFFRGQPRLQSTFQWLKQVGLDYLVLGQPLATLSGGEIQRLRLVAPLAGKSLRGPTLICADHPTAGLHPQDVGPLNRCVRDLVAIGASVLLVDDHPELCHAADCLLTAARDDQGVLVVRPENGAS